MKLLLLEHNQNKEQSEHLFPLLSDLMQQGQTLSRADNVDDLRSLLNKGNIDICFLQRLDEQAETFEQIIYDLNKEFTSTPIIIITESFNHNPIRFLNAGAEDCLTLEELSSQRLQRCIQTVLKRTDSVNDKGFIANHDPITHLANQHLLNDRLAQAVKKAQRTGTLVSLLYIQLDNHNALIESLSQTELEQLLLEVADRLISCVREVDTVARLDQSCFSVVLEEQHNLQGVVAVAEKIIGGLKIDVDLEQKSVPISASIGISLYQQDDLGMDDLLAHAEQALSEAKQAGGNQVQFYKDNLNSDMQKQLVLEKSLFQAIENDQLEIHFQPKFNLLTSRISGTEALVRWRHPEYGLLRPKEFLNYMEGTQAMEQLTVWVLEKACQQNQEWHQSGIIMGPVSVNVAARELLSDDFPAMITSTLRKTGLPPCLLELEITETSLISNINACFDRLEDLRSLGISVAIDDFGTGYTSFNYLKNFMVDTIKIDQSYVGNVDQPGPDCAITSALIGLARNLQITIVAEGVENQNQLNTLIELGADEVQGILLTPPMSASSLKNYILTNGFSLDMAMPAKEQQILAA